MDAALYPPQSSTIQHHDSTDPCTNNRLRRRSRGGIPQSAPQEVIDEVDKKDILFIQGDWNTKIGTDSTDWKKKLLRPLPPPPAPPPPSLPPVTQHPMSKDYACWSSPVTTIRCWQIPLASTRHLGAGLGMRPTEHITRSVTSWYKTVFNLGSAQARHGPSQAQMCQAIMTW